MKIMTMIFTVMSITTNLAPYVLFLQIIYCDL